MTVIVFIPTRFEEPILSKNLFEENIRDFKSRLRVRGYPDLLVNNVLAEVQFTDRKSALRQKQIMRKKIFMAIQSPTAVKLGKRYTVKGKTVNGRAPGWFSPSSAIFFRFSRLTQQKYDTFGGKMPFLT